jgi:hypothetical protein
VQAQPPPINFPAGEQPEEGRAIASDGEQPFEGIEGATDSPDGEQPNSGKEIAQWRLEFRDFRVREAPDQQVFLRGWRNRDRALLEKVK